MFMFSMFPSVWKGERNTSCKCVYIFFLRGITAYASVDDMGRQRHWWMVVNGACTYIYTHTYIEVYVCIKQRYDFFCAYAQPYKRQKWYFPQWKKSCINWKAEGEYVLCWFLRQEFYRDLLVCRTPRCLLSLHGLTRIYPRWGEPVIPLFRGHPLWGILMDTFQALPIGIFVESLENVEVLLHGTWFFF